MPEYYVNTQPQTNGDNEVHRADYCPTPAAPGNRDYLGWFSSCHGAVAKAKERYSRADGCAHCSPDCHRR